ncbi:hypothetical protein FRC08_011662 [Ceratobasidium sp. 394]|nr:hypothetical protein FRC08_011662 [Ceratobasidium sp. 394]
MPPRRTSSLSPHVRFSPLSLPSRIRFSPLRTACTFSDTLKSSYRQAFLSLHELAQRFQPHRIDLSPLSRDEGDVDIASDLKVGMVAESVGLEAEPSAEAANLEAEAFVEAAIVVEEEQDLGNNSNALAE